ncbi:MAG: hypothetical protein RTU30_16625, partial [Candidatus Thorarchaeota archaeon]
NLPFEERGREIDVKVEIQIGWGVNIEDLRTLTLSWIDPGIDDSPFTDASSNKPGKNARPIFPWLPGEDSREACPPMETLFPFGDGFQYEFFPDPQGEGSDNSDANEEVEASFKALNNRDNIYGIEFQYSEGGYALERVRELEFDLQAIFSTQPPPWNCYTRRVSATFYTSNFGGDNYILKATATAESEYGEIECDAYAPQIDVWRKLYVEYAFMEDGPEYFCHEGTLDEYEHSSGDFDINYDELMQYLTNSFDDCFIDVQPGNGNDSNTQYERVLGPYSDYTISTYPNHPRTGFHERATPHAMQVLSVDSFEESMCPLSFEDVEYVLGQTPSHHIERHHALVFYGVINDLQYIKTDSFYIDGIAIDDTELIAHFAALHELGHGIRFMQRQGQHGEIEIIIGHKSGPGVMWGIPRECNIESVVKMIRRSYFWGDHVFIMRLAADIPPDIT